MQLSSINVLNSGWIRRLPLPRAPFLCLPKPSNRGIFCSVFSRVDVSSKRGEKRSTAIGASRRGFLTELEMVKDEGVAVDYESPLKVLLYPDPRLRAKNKRIGVFDSKLEQLVTEMFEIMYRTDGVGLAAPQVGVNVRLMVYNPSGVKGVGKEYVLVNPTISKYSSNTAVEEEGCLSFPGMNADVERSLMVKISAQDLKGKKILLTLKDWQARIFQHEYDHLQGTLFHDRMKLDVLGTVRDTLQALEDKYETTSGKKSPERVADRFQKQN